MAKELMAKELVMFDVEASTKEEVISIIAEEMRKDGRLIDKEGYVADVMKREAGSSTAVGFDVATPHAKSVHVKEATLAVVKLKNEINWDDDDVVSTVFMIGVPSPGQGDKHLDILSKLFRNLVHEDFRDKLSAATTAEDIIALIGHL